MNKPIVTGIGVLAPTGLGTEQYWAATRNGAKGIGPVSRFETEQYPVVLAGEIDGFEAREHLASRLLPQTDHMTRLALVAADWALADAGAKAEELPEFSAGVVTASASGGFEFGHRELEALWSKGSEHVSAYQSFAWFYAVNTGQISIRHGLRGAGGVVVTEQAGGLDAFAMARRRLRDGAGLMLTGGVDSALCPWGWVAQIACGRLSTSADPERAYLPFDSAANGFVPGEGGAILVVEDPESAAARGVARDYGTFAGYSATFDPPPDSGRPSALRRAIENALDDAGCQPSDVDVVFADGAGVPELDLAEAEAISAVFGANGVPVTAPKTATGRLYSGGAALDLATALLALRDGLIPPTPNVSELAPGIDIDLVTGQPRRADLRTAVVLARGYGGYNSAVVLRAPDKP
ncbi:ketosynthase chain-length factor [Kutzneria viridogrisea]|uniref:Act minimal PKS chain-length factor (CLF/KS beta) n=1 Tax=Kutzneria viridogrisea TaxID=47990 RepID=A0ABR6BHU5_9PSEU|nr:act minimal PKS chain-length factor (CLF/KS beta) [Kutzneria viridogrisea]